MYFWLTVFVFWFFFFEHFEIHSPTVFWLVRFLLRNRLISLWEFPCKVISCFSLVLLIVLVSDFDSFITVCIGEDVFVLNLGNSFLNFDVQITFQIWKFSVMIALNKLFAPSSSPLLLGLQYFRLLLMVCSSSHRLSSLFFILRSPLTGQFLKVHSFTSDYFFCLIHFDVHALCCTYHFILCFSSRILFGSLGFLALKLFIFMY